MVEIIKAKWWKIITMVLLTYVVIVGLLIQVPSNQGNLGETIRNLFFHVPMWFTMLILFFIGAYYSVMYLYKQDLELDLFALAFNKAGMLFCILGLVTGMIWANYTWGKPWVEQDPKLKGAAIGFLIYVAYFVLRMSINDLDSRGRISAVYNILIFLLLIPLLFILPNLNDTLHPGNGGNSKFTTYDIDNKLRMVFYPAILGWIGMGVWIGGLMYRIDVLKNSKVLNS